MKRKRTQKDVSGRATESLRPVTKRIAENAAARAVTALAPPRVAVAAVEAPAPPARRRAAAARPRPRQADALLTAKRRATAQFMRPPRRAVTFASYSVNVHPGYNVVGVGIGRKLREGRETGDMSVRFYVERKLPEGTVPPELRLPATIGGVPTDVVESGRIRALPATTPENGLRMRPAHPGCSIGFQYGGAQASLRMAGTLGAIVRRGTDIFVLSNNHVLANENRLPIGSPIYQPGLLDGGDTALDAFARLSKFSPLKSGGRLDAAIAAVNDRTLVEAEFLPRVGRLGSAAPLDAEEGLEVEKVGRTTGYRTGRIVDVLADVNVRYATGVLRLVDQLLVEGDGDPFSDEGDSGSLVVGRESKRPVGLLCAGSESVTVANPIGRVLDTLGVTIVV